MSNLIECTLSRPDYNMYMEQPTM